MSVMTQIFGDPNTQHPAQAAVAVQQPIPAPGGQGNIPPVQQTVAEPGNPTAPVAAPVVPVEPAVPETPLDPFAKLWETAPVDPNAPKPAAPAELNVADLQKTMAKADFSSAVTPEMMAAVNAGGEGAAEAMVQGMNAMAQQLMVQSTLVNNKLTEKAVADAVAATEAKIPELLRNQTASDHLNTTNPLFQSPAIKPVIEATQAQLLQKFPNATPTELTKMTQDYIIAMGAAFAPKEVVNSNSKGEVNWDNFLEAK